MVSVAPRLLRTMGAAKESVRVCKLLLDAAASNRSSRPWRIRLDAHRSFSQQLPPPSSRTPASISSARRTWSGRTLAVAVGTTTAAATVSYLLCQSMREQRADRIQALPVFRCRAGDNNNHKDTTSQSSSSTIHTTTLTQRDLLHTVQRAGLMGTTKSVKDELHDIREWHRAHGYHGGLVVRDVTVSQDSDAAPAHAQTADGPPPSWWWQLPETLQQFHAWWKDTRSMMASNQRECYYVYYEVTPTGRHVTHLFCRGTTLAIDVWTCLQSWMVYDEDLDCYVHRGFRNTSHRILADCMPLLSRDAEIHVCGHSLGGAVGSLVAAKLAQQGYRVTQVTTVGAPAYVRSATDAATMRAWLPVEDDQHVRLEHEYDTVSCALPPYGCHVGNKVWLLEDGPARYVDCQNEENAWADSGWWNFLWPEIVSSRGWYHRIPAYLARLSVMGEDQRRQ